MVSRSFGGLAAASKPRRDSPFAAALADVSAPAPMEPAVQEVREVEAPKTNGEPGRKDRLKKRRAQPTSSALENVTVPMRDEARQRAFELARTLQRRRADKSGSRITSNTVFRVAIEHFLDSFELREGDAPEDEAAMLELARARTESRGRK